MGDLFMKMETLEQFFDRSYGTLDRVFVYPKKRGVGKPEIWTLQQRKQYIAYLNQNSVDVKNAIF